MAAIVLMLDSWRCQGETFQELAKSFPRNIAFPGATSQPLMPDSSHLMMNQFQGFDVTRKLDEYNIYNRLEEWGYGHKSVCHSAGEYARDEGGDGFHEVHVNTMEGFWSLLRSWLRPHRGISQEKLPLYLGFFECIHNIKRRGKAAISGLLSLLLS